MSKFTLSRRLFTSTQLQPKTGIVMMNMGGPKDPNDTKQFLYNLFSDSDIIPFGGGLKQDIFAKIVVSLRESKVREQYLEIGGSPIGDWSNIQGKEMCNILDNISPLTAPHKHYVTFRYVNPLTNDTLNEMKKDGIKHAIAFSQYPQWCCNTTGSSMNELWRELKKLNMENEFKWSIIDRWYNHKGYINALVDNIEYSLINNLDEKERRESILLFSAHSLPIKSVAKGDAYVFEVSATVKLVMERLKERLKNREIIINGLNNNEELFIPHHQLTWQSKVGYQPWMVPSTEEVIKSTSKNNRYNNLLIIPFVFTSDHIETLFELDIEYKKVANENNLKGKYIRVNALNNNKIFINALADIVNNHLNDKLNYSEQYKLR